MNRKFILPFLVAVMVICAQSPASAISKSNVYRVPKVDGLEVDGSGKDWGSKGFYVAILTEPDGNLLPLEDFDVRFRLAWDNQGLYVLAIVQDDIPWEHESLSRLWRCDCVEISVAQDVGHANTYMMALSPGIDPRYQGVRWRAYDWRPERENLSDLSWDTAIQKAEGGYVLEALLPWRNLGIKPSIGLKLGFQIVVNDDDGQGRSCRVSWFPEIAPADSEKMHNLLLSDDSDESLFFHVDRQIDESGYAVSIRGAKEKIGQEVLAYSGDRILVQKKLARDATGRAHAVLSWHDGENLDAWPAVRIEVSGKTLADYEKIPTFEGIIEKYIQAVGGEETFKELTTRSCRGRYFWDDDVVFSVDALAGILDNWVLSVEKSGRIERNGYDGAIGWTQGQERIERTDHLSRSVLGWWLNPQGPVSLPRYFSRLRLIGKDASNGKIVYVMESAAPNETERSLEFDAETGLLWRIDHNFVLEDYREVDGIYFPFRVVITGEKSSRVFEVTEIKHNMPIEDRIFSMPAADEVFPDAFRGIDDPKVLPMLTMEELSYRHGEMNVPCRDGRFLYDLIVENDYKRGLEIGTYNGYSTLWLGLAFRKTGGKVTTIEIDPESAREAQKNFIKADLTDVIDARINDAFEEIKNLRGEFDFVFIDADKKDYGRFLRLLKNRVKPGGAIVGHNVTNSEREMKNFLDMIENDPELTTAFHPVSAEGISVSIRKDKPPNLEEILERYIDAVGGREAISKLTTRTCKGHFIDDRPYAGPKQVISFETFSRIPDKSLFIMDHTENPEREGFDGMVRWRLDNNGLIQRKNQERSQMDYFLDPQNALRIHEYFPGMELTGTAKLRGNSVYVVKNKRKSPHFTLYFDEDTGLLVQIGYYELHDYRDVDGIKYPFRLEYSRKGGSNTYIFEDVRHNIPVEDTLFIMPKKTGSLPAL